MAHQFEKTMKQTASLAMILAMLGITGCSGIVGTVQPTPLDPKAKAFEEINPEINISLGDSINTSEYAVRISEYSVVKELEGNKPKEGNVFLRVNYSFANSSKQNTIQLNLVPTIVVMDEKGTNFKDIKEISQKLFTPFPEELPPINEVQAVGVFEVPKERYEKDLLKAIINTDTDVYVQIKNKGDLK